MKLLEIILYQSCNYKCADCPMAEWLYEPGAVDNKGEPINKISNTALLGWIDQYCSPDEWFIEITGGEPGMYPDLFDLVYNLHNRKFHGLIRTNGSLPIPHTTRFKRVTAWHKQSKKLPEYYDYIQILRNPDDNWREKEQYCIDNKIPYCVFPYKEFSKPPECRGPAVNEHPENAIGAFFTHMAAINSSGTLTTCFTGPSTPLNIFDRDEPTVVPICRMCSNIQSLDFFIMNAPGFREAFELGADKETPHDSWIVYPMLNAESEWVDEQGNILGKLGDNLQNINTDYKTAKEKMRKGVG